MGGANVQFVVILEQQWPLACVQSWCCLRGWNQTYFDGVHQYSFAIFILAFLFLLVCKDLLLLENTSFGLRVGWGMFISV